MLSAPAASTSRGTATTLALGLALSLHTRLRDTLTRDAACQYKPIRSKEDVWDTLHYSTFGLKNTHFDFCFQDMRP